MPVKLPEVKKFPLFFGGEILRGKFMMHTNATN
jgi:hypothetical protein